MYKKFKDCLLAPRNIANYVNEPKWKTWCYFLFLLIIYLLPSLIIVIFSQTISHEYAEQFVSDISSNETIHYVLENGELKKTEVNIGTEFVKTTINYFVYTIPTYLVFDETGENYDVGNKIEDTLYLMFVFSKDKISILYGQNQEVDKNGLTELATESSYVRLCSKSYSSIDVENINFARLNINDNYELDNQMTGFFNHLYKSIKNDLLPLIIICLIIGGVCSLLFTMLIITVLEKLLYRFLKLSFKKTFKIVLFAMTPYVITALLANILGIRALEILGDILTIIYTIKAITMYKIQYDGGIKISDLMNQNQKNESSQEKEGKDNNEL